MENGNDSLKCRVQYINDIDPFLQASASREPLKPVLYNIVLHQAIGEQLADIIRTVKAPHKVFTIILKPKENSKITEKFGGTPLIINGFKCSFADNIIGAPF